MRKQHKIITVYFFNLNKRLVSLKHLEAIGCVVRRETVFGKAWIYYFYF